MNVIFPAITVASIILILFNNPKTMLDVFTSATDTTVKLSITLIGFYCIWQGIANLLEKSGLSQKIAKFLKRPIQKLFNVKNEQAIYKISLNLTANALGLSGVATPSGIDSMHLLDSENNEHAKTLLTVISSTSIQILPISVIQLLSSYNQDPSTIILLTLISTTFSTTRGILLCKVFR